MKTALKLALVLLAASAAGSLTLASHGEIPAHFFVGNAGSSHSGQGYLGVDVRDIAPDQVAILHLKDVRGAEIVLVDHDAPAGKAGLHEHDVVLQLNGQAISSQDQVRRMLRDLAPGKTVVLLISRYGQQITISTQMTTREAVERQAWEQHLAPPEPQTVTADSSDSSFTSAASPAPVPSGRSSSFLGSMLMTPSYTGAMLEKMSTQLASFFGVPSNGGLLVSSVQPNSPAALAGMQAGDVVLRANDQAVTSASDWARAIKTSRGHPLSVVVLRDKKEQTLTLTPDGKKRSSLDTPSEDVAYLGLSLSPR